MRELELNSIIKFCYELLPEMNFYTKSVPQDFKVPSIYFPPAGAKMKPFSQATFALENVLSMIIFDKSRQKAFFSADKIMYSIIEGNNKIPIVTEENIESGSLYVNDVNIDLKESHIDDLFIVVCTLTWDSKGFNSKRMKDYEKINEVNMNLN
ncbi:hypothetical protein [Chengkuizengella axinellae]|uniref:DUF3168 domain-containing protein n=1 Tax=Chengkuizengella axinellae TaxID=3064388 RepID=A0ABT9IW11_9BACL|nr:hypothetical protein [Chengkuizengella sp. 2205SS18-9]MDP5273546.1 hypothetical protein [Chengkuizengella sp. 2205SS18-9]